MRNLAPDRLWPDQYWVEYRRFFDRSDGQNCHVVVAQELGARVGETFAFVAPISIRRLAPVKLSLSRRAITAIVRQLHD